MDTGTQSVGDVFSRNAARYQKQTKEAQPELLAKVPVAINKPELLKLPKLVKPMAPTWDELVELLTPIVNLPGLWITITELYDAGYGAELVTVYEMATEIHAKHPKREKPNNLFAASISKKQGNWKTKTLKLVQEVWETRHNALEAIERLDLKQESKVYRQVLALAWKLKGTIMRYVGMALEKGTGIENPAGVFFTLSFNALQQNAR